MPKLSQLAHLVFNYYRENSQEYQALEPLLLCELSRWWGTLTVTCPDPEIYSLVLKVQETLKEPIQQMRVAKRVRIHVANQTESQILLITPAPGQTLEQELKKAKQFR